MSEVKIAKAGEAKRTVSMKIANVSASALVNSGYTLSVGFYTKSNFSADSAVAVATVDSSYYPLIDAGMFNYSYELDVKELLKAAYGEESVSEIKTEGIPVYVKIWLDKVETTSAATLLGGRFDVIADSYFGAFVKSGDYLTVDTLSGINVDAKAQITGTLLGGKSDINNDTYVGAFVKSGNSMTVGRIEKLSLKSAGKYYYGVTENGATSYYEFTLNKGYASFALAIENSASLTELSVIPVYYYGVTEDGNTAYYSFASKNDVANAAIRIAANALNSVKTASEITDYAASNNSDYTMVYSLENKYGTSVTSLTAFEKASETEYKVNVALTNNCLSEQSMGALKVALYDKDGNEIAARGIYYDETTDSFKVGNGTESIVLKSEHAAKGEIIFTVGDESGLIAGEIPVSVAVIPQSKNVKIYYYTDAKYNEGEDKVESAETKLNNLLKAPEANTVVGYVLAGWVIMDKDGNVKTDEATGEPVYWNFNSDAADPVNVESVSSGDNYIYLKSVYTIAPPTIDSQPEIPVGKENLVYDGIGYTLSFEASYDAANQTIEYQWFKKAGGSETFTAINGEIGTSIDVKNVADSGVYYCKLTVKNSLNEEASTKTSEINVVITAAPLTIYPEASSVEYGADEITVKIGGEGFVNNETSEVLKAGANAYTLTKEGTTDVLTDIADIKTGEIYLVTLNAYTADNYNITIDAEKNGTIELSVTKKTLTISLEEQTVTYGETIDQTKYTITGFVKNDTVAILGEMKPVLVASALTAGENTISVAIGTLLADNYDFDLTGTAVLTVNAKELTVTPEAQTLTYGDSLDQTKYAITGFVYDEDESEISGAPGLVASAVTVAGDKTVGVEIGTLSADNYSFKLDVTNTLTINKKTLTITPTVQTLIYGESLDQSKYEVTGYITGEDENEISGAPLLTASALTVAGEKTVSVALGTLAADNYDFDVSAVCALTINRKTLTVTPEAQTIIYGEVIDQTLYAISGFVYGETVADTVEGAPVLTASSAVIAGDKTISAAIGTLTADNYDFDLTGTATLTINKREITVKANDRTKIYDGVAEEAVEIENVSLTADEESIAEEETLEIENVSQTANEESIADEVVEIENASQTAEDETVVGEETEKEEKTEAPIDIDND